MNSSQTINSIVKDLIKALPEIKGILRDKENKFLKNKYATLDSILDSSKPILQRYNLAVMQMVTSSGVETILVHESGEWISSGNLLIIPEVSKGLSAAQSVGITITYSKRYQLGSILGISSEDDNDGSNGKKPQMDKSEKQEFTPEIQEQINLITDEHGLTEYYNQVKDLQKNAEFLGALTKRKNQIQGNA